MSANGRPAVTEEQVATWVAALQADDQGALTVAFRLKRWDARALAALEVGYDGERFTFPIRDDGGALCGLVRYQPGGEPKSLALPGTQRELFPQPTGSDLWLLLVEGEPDAITARSAGLPAVAFPGTQGWKKGMARRFAGVEVVAVPDCDEQGRAAGEKIAADLYGVAESVRILDLAPGRDDHYDLGDALREDVETPDELRAAGQLLRERANQVPVYVPPSEQWAPLSVAPTTPSFPVAVLPAAVREWVEATAEATQTPPDLSACAALGVLSACVTGGVAVEVAPGWEEEACLYAVCALPSGDRKSSAVRAATAPLREVERDWGAQAAPGVAEAKTRREAIEQRRRKLIQDAGRADTSVERESLATEAGSLAAELAEQDEPHVPRLLADDATPEALAGLLARYRKIAIIAAESAFLDNLGGRYSDGRSNLHLVCQAYGGEPTTIDRRGREPETLDRPLLTMALCVQPHVLAALVADPTARAQGFVARCLIARPGTRLGYRKTDAAPVPEATTRKWAALVRRLARPENRDTSDRTPGTTSGDEVSSLLSPVLRLSDDATALLYGLRAAEEPLLRDDGPLRPIADWQARHAGRIVRIAALLHLAAEEPGDEISADTMERALAIGEWALAHALDVLTGPDPEVRRALAWLDRNGEPEVSLRDLQRGTHLLADEAESLARRLETHGALRPLDPPPTGKHGGRPPSPRFAVHPDLVVRR